MTRQSPPELFAQRPVRSDFGRYQQRGTRINMRRVFFLLCLLGVAIGGGFLISSLGGSEGDGEGIPHITAEGPIKEKPENPGGIDIPHQDVQVFHELDGKTNPVQSAGSKVEHLLPAPETPQPVAMETTKPDMQTPPASEVIASVSEPKVQTVPAPIDPQPAAQALPDETAVKADIKTFEEKPAEKQAPAKVEPKKVVEPVKPKPAVQTQPVKKVEEPVGRLPAELFTTGEAPAAKAEPALVAAAQPKTVETAAPASGKKVRLQLASLPDQDAAQKMAQKLQSQHAATLGSATLTVVKAEIAGKGTYYRVMSAPMPEMQAKSICADLSKKKAACLVAR